jgi:hypothetical protein
MKKSLSGSLLSMVFMLAAFGEDEVAPKPSIAKSLALNGIDGMVITVAPKADFSEHTVKKVTLNDQKEIEQLIALLEKIPAQGPGLMIKMDAQTTEYTIDFHKNKNVVATLRIKGSKLDSPQGTGWDFYPNEDGLFVQMVEKRASN